MITAAALESVSISKYSMSFLSLKAMFVVAEESWVMQSEAVDSSADKICTITF